MLLSCALPSFLTHGTCFVYFLAVCSRCPTSVRAWSPGHRRYWYPPPWLAVICQMTSAVCPRVHRAEVGSAGSWEPRSPCLAKQIFLQMNCFIHYSCRVFYHLLTKITRLFDYLAFEVLTYSPHSGTLEPQGVPPASPHASLGGQSW